MIYRSAGAAGKASWSYDSLVVPGLIDLATVECSVWPADKHSWASGKLEET